MPDNEEASMLLDKLGRKIWDQNRPPESKPFEPAGSTNPTVYRNQGAFPGKAYTLIGNSYSIEYMILGSEMEARRRSCIALLLERKGDSHRCVRLGDALAFEGFCEILSRSERAWLSQLPPDTFIGPSFDRRAQRIRSTFAVWQRTCEEPQPRLLRTNR